MLKYCSLPRSIVQISGENSKSFLQGLITQDINKLNNETSIFSLLLTNKGRYLLDFFIIKNQDTFLIDIASSDVALLEQTLKHYKLRAKVTITANTSLGVYAVFLSDINNAPTSNNKAATSTLNTTIYNNNILMPDSRLTELGIRIITTNKDFIKDKAIINVINNHFGLSQTNNIALVEESEYTKLRYSLVVPETTELIKEKSIPLECGFDKLNAISFNKGCYLGQEFTNASKRTLVIRKRLLTFKSNNNFASTCKNNLTPIIEATTKEKIGTIIAVQNNYCMAVAKIDSIKNYSNFLINNTKVEPIIPNWLKKNFY